MAGRHRAIAYYPPAYGPASAKAAYQRKVAGNFERRIMTWLKFTAITPLWSWIIGLIVMKAISYDYQSCLGGGGSPYDVCGDGGSAPNGGKWFLIGWLLPVAFFLALGVIWSLWCLLIEAFPAPFAVFEAYQAGEHTTTGHVGRAALSGTAAYQLSKMAAEKRGEQWTGVGLPNGWTPSPEAAALGLGLVAGVADDLKEKR